MVQMRRYTPYRSPACHRVEPPLQGHSLYSRIRPRAIPQRDTCVRSRNGLDGHRFFVEVAPGQVYLTKPWNGTSRLSQW